MSGFDPSPALAPNRSRRCARCGRFRRSTDGELCQRCRPTGQRSLEDPPEAEGRVESIPSPEERAILLRRAREDFVVPRPSELHSGVLGYAGLHAPGPAGPGDARRSRRLASAHEAEPAGPMGRTRSRIRTAAIMLAIILVGGLVAAGIPLLLSWIGT